MLREPQPEPQPRVSLSVSRATVLIGVSGQNYGATVFSSDLTFMSKNASWLLGLMDLGANLKI